MLVKQILALSLAVASSVFAAPTDSTSVQSQTSPVNSALPPSPTNSFEYPLNMMLLRIYGAYEFRGPCPATYSSNKEPVLKADGKVIPSFRSAYEDTLLDIFSVLNVDSQSKVLSGRGLTSVVSRSGCLSPRGELLIASFDARSRDNKDFYSNAMFVLPSARFNVSLLTHFYGNLGRTIGGGLPPKNTPIAKNETIKIHHSHSYQQAK